jgi:hypothetical protein
MIKNLRPIAYLALLLPLAVAGPGCGSSQKVFKITSHPRGATIFVDDVRRGQTDMEKLSISFKEKTEAIIRLEKEGYQGAGKVLKIESDDVQFFALDESPENKKILETLNGIRRDLERFMNQLVEMTRKSKAEGE